MNDERIVAAWVRTPPATRRPSSAIVFDLDHFGRFNKEHGHLVGDAALRAFGDILQRRFRASDLVARFSGEEFVAILEGTTLDDAVQIAEEVRLAFPATPQALVHAADIGLFSAKRAGRDRVVAVPAAPSPGPRPSVWPQQYPQRPAFRVFSADRE